MNGPHGLFMMKFDRFARLAREKLLPLEVTESLHDDPDSQGVRTVYFMVTDQFDEQGLRNVYADAFCNFVEGDYATRDAAAQWLLDWCNVKHGA